MVVIENATGDTTVCSNTSEVLVENKKENKKVHAEVKTSSLAYVNRRNNWSFYY